MDNFAEALFVTPIEVWLTEGRYHSFDVDEVVANCHLYGNLSYRYNMTRMRREIGPAEELSSY